MDNGASNVNLVLYPEEFGGHGELAFACLFAGYEIILDYQIISPKGDLNCAHHGITMPFINYARSKENIFQNM